MALDKPFTDLTDEKADSRRVHGPPDLEATEVSIADAATKTLHGMRRTGDSRLSLPQAPGESKGKAKKEAWPQTALLQHAKLQA